MTALSNAGGLSGAASNVPIMLIFFNLSMNQIVPISAFIGVCATFLRFVMLFNKKHPKNNERNLINYEIVELTLPFVFLGSFIGVFLATFMSELLKQALFSLAILWSIKITVEKTIELRVKEIIEEKAKEAALYFDCKVDDNLIEKIETASSFIGDSIKL